MKVNCGPLLKQFCMSPEVAVNGGFYLLIIAHGGRYTIGSRLGLKRKYGMSYSSHFILNTLWNIL